MTKTVCVTIVKTIEITDAIYLNMTNDELTCEFEDLYSLDEWNWDDESHTVEIFNTDEVVKEVGDNVC